MGSSIAHAEQSAPAPDERPQWEADVAGLRDEQRHHNLFPLRMGDRFHELQLRWGEKMPALARAAGVPYPTARRHACIARQIPADSRIRRFGFPISILRLLAPLGEHQQRWAERAWSLQQRGKLNAREF